MIKNYLPLNFVEANNCGACNHLTDVPEVPEHILQEKDFQLMFIKCPSVKFVDTTVVIKRPEPQVISEPKKFDDFDWDKDFSEAYKE
jgi:hypothetical protein